MTRADSLVPGELQRTPEHSPAALGRGPRRQCRVSTSNHGDRGLRSITLRRGGLLINTFDRWSLLSIKPCSPRRLGINPQEIVATRLHYFGNWLLHHSSDE